MIITVRQLADLAGQEIAKGNGNKKVYISQDDEGNGYHALFYGFTSDKKDLEEIKEYCYGLENEELDNVVVLG